MTRPLITTDPDCANAITVEPWFAGFANIRVMVACQRDLGGCGWSCSFAGAPDLRRIPWSRVLGEVGKHLGAIPDSPTKELSTR